MQKQKRKKNVDYFDYFSEIAGYAANAADTLRETLANFNAEECHERCKEIHEIENNADIKKHEMVEHLLHEFITPIEREDIIALAQELDNVVDSIDDVMRRMYMFNIVCVRHETQEFTSLISRCCHALWNAAREFKNFKRANEVKKHVIEVNTLEGYGDVIHEQSIRRLFTESNDTRNIIIWTTMFECFESCLDACEDAADIIESVIMKNT